MEQISHEIRPAFYNSESLLIKFCKNGESIAKSKVNKNEYSVRSEDGIVVGSEESQYIDEISALVQMIVWNTEYTPYLGLYK